MALRDTRPLSAGRRGRYSDRFIPSRTGSGDLHGAFALMRGVENGGDVGNVEDVDVEGGGCYGVVLKNELLEGDAEGKGERVHPGLEGLRRVGEGVGGREGGSSVSAPVSGVGGGNLFRFKDRPLSAPAGMERDLALAAVGPFCLRPAGTAASGMQRSLLSGGGPARATRKIARAPFKVLDAPCLQNDFYLNLVDWSSENVLAVGLDTCVYLWSACTSLVTKLCDLHFGGPVCSVSWSQQGTELAVGTCGGGVQIWDTTSCKLLRTMTGHTSRVGSLAWSSTLLSSGGRDREIYNRDLRCREPYVAQLTGHKQEVCGLRWSHDDMQLASGGNDNKLLIWNASGLGSGGGVSTTGSGAAYNSPVLRFTHHEAAVKAIAWSPHARGLLASGGGTQDRKIRFWNTLTNSALAAVDTGSQVCNLAWSKNVNEIVSTHGYSQNQIIVWKYPSLTKVVTLTGHTCRVLYLAVSPSGETIVTGAGDETLRFWNVFPSAKCKRGSLESASLLSPDRMHIR